MSTENEMANTDVEAAELIENTLVEALGILSKRVLPVTSTINDNAQLMGTINDLSHELRKVRYQVKPGTYSLNANLGKLFGIPSSSSFSIYDAPEAVGEVAVAELKTLVERIGQEKELHLDYGFLPSDEELNDREKKVNDYYKLSLCQKEVDRWFADFFGPKTRTVRTRWQRFFFVVYLEKEIEK